MRKICSRANSWCTANHWVVYAITYCPQTWILVRELRIMIKYVEQWKKHGILLAYCVAIIHSLIRMPSPWIIANFTCLLNGILIIHGFQFGTNYETFNYFILQFLVVVSLNSIACLKTNSWWMNYPMACERSVISIIIKPK